MTDPDPSTNQQAGSEAPQAPPQMWAIVELMGHQRIAGAISQDTTMGGPLLRVDVPAVTYLDHVYRNGAYVDVPRTIPAHSRSIGTPAIYTVHWVDEATARLAAVSIKANPLKLISLQSALDAVPEAERQQLLRLTRTSTLIAADHDGDNDEPF